MNKRKWHYIASPVNFDLHCDASNEHKTYWSEFENCIWCFECEKDIEYKPGCAIFPVKIAEILGITFDKIDLENNLYLRYDSTTNEYTEEKL